MSDKEKLTQVATAYRELRDLQAQQRATMAKMIRACVAHIRSPDSRKRKEGLKALSELAEMLEKEDPK